MDQMGENVCGWLVVTLFVANHDDSHRGRPRTIARIPCEYGNAVDIFRAWKGANTWADEYNLPVHGEFVAHSVPL